MAECIPCRQIVTPVLLIIIAFVINIILVIMIIVIIQTANVLLVKTESTARKEESDAKRDNHCWTGSYYYDFTITIHQPSRRQRWHLLEMEAGSKET